MAESEIGGLYEPMALEKDGRLFQPRKYQNEMLRLSLKQNIIVAMDTGSGKTAIAVLRIREELERCSKGQVVWFLVPTVALAEQQCLYINEQLPSFPTRILAGKDGVDTWSTKSIWDKALLNIDIVVCTHQVLLDALSHGFVSMSKIALLVFDEAHHCTRDHPANRIMQTFYHAVKRDRPGDVPHILGLTASPVTRAKENSLQTIEQNLDAISRTPKENRDELMAHVHRPVMITQYYDLEDDPPISAALETLIHIHETTDIRKDPYLIELAGRKSPLYLKTVLNRRTYSQDQMNTFVCEARRISSEIGTWASATFIAKCVQRYTQARNYASDVLMGTDVEKQYLCDLLAPLRTERLEETFTFHYGSISDKVAQLIHILVRDMKPDSAGIVFVTRRADVALLSMMLDIHPATKELLRVGTFIGTSEFGARASTLSRLIEIKNQDSTLDDLRSGVKNLIICTSVCEEGIDISACNSVVCFDPPPNLKSMIQRRGRARHKKSQFMLMLPQQGQMSRDLLGQWLYMEKRMEEQYMDDMRELEALKDLESEDQGHREFIVKSTKAKLTLKNAVQHLYHFCNKLPSAEHTVLAPIFSCEVVEDEDNMNDVGEETRKTFTCRVVLPIAVDASIREFSSRNAWESEKMARRDAAFEAYVRLYDAGLIDNHLLPSPRVDEDVANAYVEIAKRPSEVEVSGQYNPWPSVAVAWSSTSKIYQYTISMKENDETHSLRLVSPLPLPELPTFTLYVNASTSMEVSLSDPLEFDKTSADMMLASGMTRVLLLSLYGTRMGKTSANHTQAALGQLPEFPLLFLSSTYNGEDWLERMSGTYPASRLLSEDGLVAADSVGVVREQTMRGGRHIFQSIEWMSKEGQPDDEPQFAHYLRCKPLPKRRDYLHPIPTNVVNPTGTNSVFLDSEICTIDHLPYSQARLALFIPSIMHKIGICLTTNHLCRTILSPVKFTNPGNILQATSTAPAQEGSDYQRLEFLGDIILKIFTSVSLITDRPKWHEGYLSKHKDHIVSNGRLALAAQQTGLDRFILTVPFTGQKWRPLYNSTLLTPTTVPETRKMSTKTLADVVEALLGAAYLDGGFPKALGLLRIFIPEVPWQPLESYSTSLHAAASTSSSSSPYNTTATAPTYHRLHHLEKLLGHTFTHKHLLLEAITHPSYPSTSATPTSSYQRLEFLGDAILDYIVTTAIFRANAPPLPLHTMHLLKTASVNASFLAFRSLSTTISIPTSTAPQTLSLTSFLRASPSMTLTTALAATTSRYNTLSPLLTPTLNNPNAPYPWRLLAAFSPEKLVSDLAEAVVAAVWIDTRGSFEACERLLRRFGVLGWLEEKVAVGGGGIWHPKEEVGMRAGWRTVRYEVSGPMMGEPAGERGTESTTEVVVRKATGGEVTRSMKQAKEEPGLGRGPYTCRLFVGDDLLCRVSGWNRSEVEVAAAEEGVRVLKKEAEAEAGAKQAVGGLVEQGRGGDGEMLDVL